jgi:methylenetetrahydrofolate--tRNA-(uracil-5-)-methyltransferase
MKADYVTVVGGGLAGSEAAWQIARRGVDVRLYEMRPARKTAVHKTDRMAELVCSNSLKSLELSTPHGLLKQEMDRLGSLILDCAREHRVPAGGALGVDRGLFAEAVTAALTAEPRVTIVREEVAEIPEGGVVILAVGPLVSPGLAASIAAFTGRDYLYFFDAIAPVVEADSIDRSIAFAASRYGKGEGEDYLNCPMNQEQYDRFIDALLESELAPLHDIDDVASDAADPSAVEKTPYFEGCLPIEVMAGRGRQTLAFGPMKPVGLTDPATGRRAHAVVQLRQDNLAAEHYSMVGFQTQLRWPEQKRIFRMIPGMENAEFVRLGQVHRNCYINAPTILDPDLQTRKRPGLFFAGQISGVEGYTESAATGLLAGINAARMCLDQPTVRLPLDTMLGALCHYIAHADADDYQPTNAAFGLLPPAPRGVRRKRDRRLARSARALEALDAWIATGAQGLEGSAP